MSGQIVFYSKDLSFIACTVFYWRDWGYGYESPADLTNTLKQKAVLPAGMTTTVPNRGVYERIEILDHGSPGMASIGKSSTIASSTGVITHDPGMINFWSSLRPYLGNTSGLVLNMCNVGRLKEGSVLLREIQRLTGGIVYGAIKDMTTEVGMHYFNDPT